MSKDTKMLNKIIGIGTTGYQNKEGKKEETKEERVEGRKKRRKAG